MKASDAHAHGVVHMSPATRTHEHTTIMNTFLRGKKWVMFQLNAQESKCHTLKSTLLAPLLISVYLSSFSLRIAVNAESSMVHILPDLLVGKCSSQEN